MESEKQKKMRLELDAKNWLLKDNKRLRNENKAMFELLQIVASGRCDNWQKWLDSVCAFVNNRQSEDA